MKLSKEELIPVFEYIEEIEDDFSMIKKELIDKEKQEIKNFGRFSRRMEILAKNVKNILEILTRDSKCPDDSLKLETLSEGQNLKKGKKIQFKGSFDEIFEQISKEISEVEGRLCQDQNEKKNEIIEAFEMGKTKIEEDLKKALEEKMKDFGGVAEDIETEIEKIQEISNAVTAQLKGIRANEHKKTEKLGKKLEIFSGEICKLNEDGKKACFVSGEISKKVSKMKKFVDEKRNARLSRKSEFPVDLRSKISLANYPLKESFKNSSSTILALGEDDSFIMVKKESGFCIFENSFPKFYQDFENCFILDSCYASGFYYLYDSENKISKIDKTGENYTVVLNFEGDAEADFGYALKSSLSGRHLIFNSDKNKLKIYSVEKKSGDLSSLLEINLISRHDFIQDFCFLGETEILILTEIGEISIYSLNLKSKEAKFLEKIDLGLFEKNQKSLSVSIDQDFKFAAISTRDDFEEKNSIILLNLRSEEGIEKTDEYIMGRNFGALKAVQFQEKSPQEPLILNVIPEDSNESHIFTFECKEGKILENERERQKIKIKKVRKLIRTNGGKLYGVGSDSKLLEIQYFKP